MSITHTQKNTTNQVEALHKSEPQQGADWLVHLTFSFGSFGAALVATLMQDTSAEMFVHAPVHGCPSAEKYILASPRSHPTEPWSPIGPMPELLGPSTVEDCTSDWRFRSTCAIQTHASVSAGRMTSKSPFHAPALVAHCPLSTTGAQVRKNTEVIFQSVG